MRVEERTYWRVPREWSGTVHIVGGGPSLGSFDFSRFKGKRVIACNSSFYDVPWADVVHWSDARWYDWNEFGLKRHTGKYKIARHEINCQGIHQIKRIREQCLYREPDGTAGRDTGGSAINLAFHFGAEQIILHGFDMRRASGDRNNYHSLHLKSNVDNSRYEKVFIPHIKAMVEPLREAGVEVINATPGSALTCFPYLHVDKVL